MSKRHSKTKSIRPTFLVFCEGETEAEYVRFLRTKYRLASISIIAKVSGLNVSNQYIKKYRDSNGLQWNEKDKIYLMFDLDAEAVLLNLRKVTDAVIISSNPCVELWFLLHNQSHTAFINSDTCKRKLIEIIPNYEKGKLTPQLRNLLESKVDEAVNRASTLVDFENPSTRVYKLIQDLEQELTK